MIVFLLAIFIYLFVIKYFQIDIYLMNVNPRIGLILKNIINYSGVNSFYNLLAINNFFGLEIKEKVLNQEIIMLENKY